MVDPLCKTFTPVRSIALPSGADLLWIRVGGLLDPLLGRQPANQKVESIVMTGDGFEVVTSSQADRRHRYYNVPRYAVSRVELPSGRTLRHGALLQ